MKIKKKDLYKAPKITNVFKIKTSLLSRSKRGGYDFIDLLATKAVCVTAQCS